MSERAQKIFRGIPSALRAELIAEAERTGTNMNDVAVQILADRFGMSFKPSGKLSPGWADKPMAQSLTMPRRLRRRYNVEAARLETDATSLMLDTLMDHFKLETVAA